jgi:hypothetical protein
LERRTSRASNTRGRVRPGPPRGRAHERKV